jgi:hypothetical protein
MHSFITFVVESGLSPCVFRENRLGFFIDFPLETAKPFVASLGMVRLSTTLKMGMSMSGETG